MFGLKSPDLDFSKESTHGFLKHRYAEFIVWEWDLVVSLVRYLTTGRFLKWEDHKKYYSGMKGSQKNGLSCKEGTRADYSLGLITLSDHQMY